MNKIIILLLFVLCFQSALAQVVIDSAIVEEYYDDNLSAKDIAGINDSSEVIERRFSETDLQSLKEDPSFDFKEAPTVAETLWDRILQWLAEFFSTLVNGAVTINWVKFFIYLAVLALLIIVIMMILKVDAFKVFYSGQGASSVKYNLFEENIHEIDFETEIQNSINKQDYRKAVRLIFLYSLKILSDKQLISWEQGKTNHDYVGELPHGEVKEGLNELSFYFDYAWYGNFAINKELVEKVLGIFNAWKGQVR